MTQPDTNMDAYRIPAADCEPWCVLSIISPHQGECRSAEDSESCSCPMVGIMGMDYGCPIHPIPNARRRRA